MATFHYQVIEIHSVSSYFKSVKLQVIVNHNHIISVSNILNESFKGCECLVWVWYECGLIIWGFIH